MYVRLQRKFTGIALRRYWRLKTSNWLMSWRWLKSLMVAKREQYHLLAVYLNTKSPSILIRVLLTKVLPLTSMRECALAVSECLSKITFYLKIHLSLNLPKSIFFDLNNTFILYYTLILHKQKYINHHTSLSFSLSKNDE